MLFTTSVDFHTSQSISTAHHHNSISCVRYIQADMTIMWRRRNGTPQREVPAEVAPVSHHNMHGVVCILYMIVLCIVAMRGLVINGNSIHFAR